MPQYEIGQKLWFAPSHGFERYHKAREVTVQKIGRKWITVSDGRLSMRFDPAGDDSDNPFPIDIDGGEWQSPGTIWPGREACSIWHQADAAYTKLKNDMPWHAPYGVTAEDVAQARKLLGFGKE